MYFEFKGFGIEVELLSFNSIAAAISYANKLAAITGHFGYVTDDMGQMVYELDRS